MNKTPIERLKAMLKERGVEYKDEMASEDSTAISWRHDDDYATFCEHSDGTCTLIFDADNVTPEQAIAATLGSDGVDVCKPIEAHDCLSGTDCPAWRCSVCGELFEAGASFCSNCGAKVVSE